MQNSRTAMGREPGAVVASVLLVSMIVSCRPPAGPPPVLIGTGQTDAGNQTASLTEEAAMTMQVTSAAFSEGQPIPVKYTGDGKDVSPPLSWSNAPEGTQELALICDDPDAPTAQPWVHWVIYKLPSGTMSLPEEVAKTETLTQPQGAMQGENSWPSGQTIGYRGPAPPPGHGTHHYHFKVFALGAKLEVRPGLDKPALLKAMQGHILAQGELVGTYKR